MKTKNIYRGIYDHIEIPIFLIAVDAKGDFTYLGCNPAHERATNLKLKDLEGKRPEEIPGISTEEAAVLREKIETCLAQGEGITYEEKLVRHDNAGQSGKHYPPDWDTCQYHGTQTGRSPHPPSHSPVRHPESGQPDDCQSKGSGNIIRADLCRFC
jgi:PAS domain-containing protein